MDTGACPSFIDVSIAKELGLRFIDKGKSRNVFGAREVRIYTASIEICQLKYKRRAPFPAIDLIGAGMPFKAIIGRDFLSELNMDYDGWTGRVTLRRLGMSGA